MDPTGNSKYGGGGGAVLRCGLRLFLNFLPILMFFLYRIVYSFNWGGLAAMVALSLQIVVGSLAGIAYALIVIRRFPPPWKKTKKNEIKS